MRPVRSMRSMRNTSLPHLAPQQRVQNVIQGNGAVACETKKEILSKLMGLSR